MLCNLIYCSLVITKKEKKLSDAQARLSLFAFCPVLKENMAGAEPISISIFYTRNHLFGTL